ncbi:MAG: hypothetical protein ACRDRX_14460 [Pseudonocardiaceae bacterium]
MSRARYRYHHHRGPVGLPVVPLLVLCAAVLAAVGVAGAALVAVVAILLPFMLLAVGTVVVVRHLHRRHRRSLGRRQPAPAQASRLTRAAPAPDWGASRARFTQLRGEYGRFECDPLAVLRLPALADVTVPATSRFVDAFAEAQALDTDTEPSAAHLARYATAVDQACRAWQAAREAAERIRLAGIPEHERATVQRAIKLLTMARDSDHDAERIAAYAKARTELAKLERSGTLRLPVAAAAAVDAAARGQLPAVPVTE